MILEDDRTDVAALAEGVAEARDVHAEELELGAQVRAGEDRGLVAREAARDDLRHLVSGRDEAVDHAAVEGHLADDAHARIARSERVVHDDPTARADLEPGDARDLVARHDAGRDDDHLALEEAVVVELDSSHLGVADEPPRHLAEVERDAERLDLLLEDLRSALIDLTRHEARRQLDDVGAEPSFLYGARGFEPEEPASDDRAARDARASSHDRVQVLDGAVDEDAFEFDAGKAWHEGRRTRRDHHVIVGNSLAARGLDEPELTIDPRRLHTDAELDAAIAVPRLVGEAELVGGGRGEVARELHAIVGGAGLLAQHGDAEASARVEGSDLFAEAMAHHAMRVAFGSI